MSKYNVPIIRTENNIIENRLSNKNSNILIIPDEKLLIDCIVYFFDKIIEENNETRIKQLEKELNYFCNYSKVEQFSLDFSIKETRTIEEVPFDKPAAYNFNKGTKKDKIEEDNFSLMFGYEDDVAIEQKKQKEKPVKQKKSKKIKDEKEVIREPEIIQESLNDNDIKKCDKLKERFKFINYQFERLYHSTYLIAIFKDNNNCELVLIKFNNDYLLTNKGYLNLFKGESFYESISSSNRNE